jgi:hypothetical protein
VGCRYRREEGEEGKEREESGEEHGADVVGVPGTTGGMCDERRWVEDSSVGRWVGEFEEYRPGKPLPLSGEEWGWSRTRTGL